MNARFYVGGIGRFASADTIIPDPNNPQSYNRYSYVYNNPTSFNDPNGYEPCPSGAWGDCTPKKEEWDLLEEGAGRTRFVDIEDGQLSLGDAEHSVSGVCETVATYADCWNEGGVLSLEDNHQLDTEEFNEMLDLLYSELYEADTLTQLSRATYDTPFYHGGEENTSVCFDTGECFRRSTINYIAQGAWSAKAGSSPIDALFVTQTFKMVGDRNFLPIQVIFSKENPYFDSLQMTIVGYYGYKAYEAERDAQEFEE